MVFSSAVPKEPPTCWAELMVAAAAPVSCGATLRVARLIEGMNTMPMPKPSSSSPGSTVVAKELATVSWVSTARPPAASARPVAIRLREGTLVISRAAMVVELSTIAPVIGRNATPVITGEYPLMTCR